MKNKLLIILALLVITSSANSQKKVLSETLITAKGDTLSKDTLSKGVWIVLFTTYECGYCMRDIKYNNSFWEKYKEQVNLIALFNHDSAKIIALEKTNAKKLNWTKIPNSFDIQQKYGKYGGVYPQIHIYNKGKLVKIIADASDESKRKLIKFLDKLTATKK